MAIERIQASFARKIPQWMFDIRVPRDSRDKLTQIQQTLYENPSWNVILYFNHVAYGDPGIWGYIARSIDPDATRIGAVLASKYHTSFRNNPPFAALARLGETLTGIHVIPTIQAYMKNDPRYGYSDADASRNQKQMLKAIQGYRRRKPVMLLVSPEGHRSEDGVLGQPEKGVVSLGSMLAPALFVPTGVYYDGDFRRNSINMRSKKNPVVAIASVGEPFLQERRHDRISITTMMQRLARTLPRELRGEWA